ncbi:hypothetical protein PTTG_27448 [Puccinia triticina 1-1 BBBD Race 1]|uniref:Uncharacterized protein n=1 Tax=Puccinia triticina (isolate 1-1 / race 1 (BBBD)) TaxID=630390 RepID=A0A180GJN4_PUCT1|nr:hypothetical protein PTTG_27448 [Puccinia triticina 1-1 BBBD Race 1]
MNISSMKKHKKYDKHKSLLAAYIAGRDNRRIRQEDQMQGNHLEEMITANQVPASPAESIEFPTAANIAEFEGIIDLANVSGQPGLSQSPGDCPDDLSNASSSDPSSENDSDSCLSEYDSDNEADGEEWDAGCQQYSEEKGNPPNENIEEMPDLNEGNHSSRQRRRQPQGPNIYWLFTSKEYLVASLLIGYTHTIISCRLYGHIKMMFKLFDVRLPDWLTVRREKENIQKLLNLDVVSRKLILDTPTYSLPLRVILSQEVANPLVSSVLDFYPKDAHGKTFTNYLSPENGLRSLISKHAHQCTATMGPRITLIITYSNQFSWYQMLLWFHYISSRTTM